VASQFATIDEYIGSFPEDVQVILEKIRHTIRNAAPGAEEIISYGIPTFTLGGKHLVYFAAWKRYISVYPLPAGGEGFEREIAPYRAAKSTARFPLGKPIPYDLIARLVALHVEHRLAAEELRYNAH
jgi:uncharacterized protein YdhG (YjbR/CyaY superfamily)